MYNRPKENTSGHGLSKMSKTNKYYDKINNNINIPMPYTHTIHLNIPNNSMPYYAQTPYSTNYMNQISHVPRQIPIPIPNQMQQMQQIESEFMNALC
jgi:hypothetical protein